MRDDPTHPAAIEIDRVGASVIRGVETGALEMTAADFIDYWSGGGAWQTMLRERQQATLRVMPKILREFIAERTEHDCGRASLAAYARIDAPLLRMSGERSTAGARRVCELLRGIWPHGWPQGACDASGRGHR